MDGSEKLYVVFTHDKTTHENWYFGTYTWKKAWEVIDTYQTEWGADSRYSRNLCRLEDVKQYEIKNMEGAEND